MKTIYIVLTRSTTIVSKLVYLFTAADYTHVSISFDKELQPLYSSSRKNGTTMFPAGPCIESFQRGYLKKHREIPCAVYELEVTDEVYDKAKREVARIMRNSDDYHFNILGLILCYFNIPYHRKGYYFCSQLVSEVLLRSDAVPLPKDPELMRPSDYAGIKGLSCCYRGCLGDVV